MRALMLNYKCTLPGLSKSTNYSPNHIVSISLYKSLIESLVIKTA